MHVEKKALARAQKVLRTVVLPRPVRPILGCVLIRDGFAYATDLQHQVRVRLAAPGHGPFLVPWSAFRALRGDVDIEPLDGQVRLGRATVGTFPVTDFPAAPEEVSPVLRPVDTGNLLLHLRRCEEARATEELARALLTAVAVTDDGELLATNGFCAYWSTDGAARPLREAAGGASTLPGVAYKVLHAFGWPAAEVGATVTTRASWYFRAPDGEAAWLQGLEGRYFAVRDLVPHNFPTTIAVNRAELTAALTEALKTAAAEAPHAVTMVARRGGVRLHAADGDGGRFTDAPGSARVDGGPITLGVNAKQALSLLEVAAEGLDEVRLEVSGTNSLLRVAVEHGVWVQMPLELPDGAETEDGQADAVPAGPAVTPESVAEPGVGAATPDAIGQVEPTGATAEADAPDPAEAAGDPHPAAAAPTGPEWRGDAAPGGETVVEEPDDGDLRALLAAAQAAVDAALATVSRLLAS